MPSLFVPGFLRAAAVFAGLLVLQRSAPFLLSQRQVFSGKGSSTDTPAAHPLSYWTDNPMLRDDGRDLCIGCMVNGEKLTFANYKASVEVTTLGALADHQILHLLISVHGDAATRSVGSEFKWKLLLESIAADSYKELYHLQPSGGTLSNAAIVEVGRESILASNDPDGGNGGGCSEGYWYFDAAGAHQLNFSKVYQAVDAIVPHSTTHPSGCYTLHLEDQLIRVPVQESNAPCHACGWIRYVIAHFHLDGAKAVPENVAYTPEAAE